MEIVTMLLSQARRSQDTNTGGATAHLLTLSEKAPCFGKEKLCPPRGVQTLGVSGPHWKEKSCLGPHIQYANTDEQKRF